MLATAGEAVESGSIAYCSKAASSLPARWCSGCATVSAVRRSDDVEATRATGRRSWRRFSVPGSSGSARAHWDPNAAGHRRLDARHFEAHIARAALIRLNSIGRLLAAMQRDGDQPLTEVRVDGGGEERFAAAVPGRHHGVPVVRLKCRRRRARRRVPAGLATASGAESTKISALWRAKRRFEPAMQASRRRDELTARWHKAVERSRHWAA